MARDSSIPGWTRDWVCGGRIHGWARRCRKVC